MKNLFEIKFDVSFCKNSYLYYNGKSYYFIHESHDIETIIKDFKLYYEKIENKKITDFRLIYIKNLGKVHEV